MKQENITGIEIKQERNEHIDGFDEVVMNKADDNEEESLRFDTKPVPQQTCVKLEQDISIGNVHVPNNQAEMLKFEFFSAESPNSKFAFEDPNAVMKDSTEGTEDNFTFDIKEEQDNKTDTNLEDGQEDQIPIHLCEICFKPYKQIGSLKRHYRTQHGMSILYTCSTCQMSFDDKSALEKHQEIPCGEMLNSSESQVDDEAKMPSVKIEESDIELLLSRQYHSCSVCQRTFKYKDKLKQHELIHSDVRKFCCQICPAQFKRKSQFHAHMRVHTGKN